MTPSVEKLYKRALGRLSVSDMTPRALYEWLVEKEPGADHADAKEAVRQLARDGFVDEKRSFEALLFEGERKLWGELKFREELKKRNFSEKFSDRFGALEIDFGERAKALAKTLCPNGVSSDAEKRKLISRLAAKGHSFENARSAAISVTSGDAGEE